MRAVIVITTIGIGLLLPTQARGDTNLYLDQAVMIICGNSSGAGFYIDESHVMTAKHVMGNCKSAKVISNSKKSSQASISYLDKVEDIAILLTDKSVAKQVNFDMSEISVGKTIYTVGSPIDGLVLSKGKVVQSDSFESSKRIYLEIPADHGNSGGPVFSDLGLVGMVTSKSDTQVIAYNLQTLKKSIGVSEDSKPNSSNVLAPFRDNSMLPALQLSVFLNLAFFILVIVLAVKLRKNRKIEITLD